MNNTPLEKVRCMLAQSSLGKQLNEAVTYASHLINRLPTVANEGRTSLKVWFGSHTNDYDQLHTFGSPTYYHVQESKLDPRAKK